MIGDIKAATEGAELRGGVISDVIGDLKAAAEAAESEEEEGDRAEGELLQERVKGDIGDFENILLVLRIK